MRDVPMSERPTVYLVDGTAYVYRAFFAIRQQLSTSAGLPTKAVFGFKNMLQKLVQKEKPQYLGVAFDERGPRPSGTKWTRITRPTARPCRTTWRCRFPTSTG